MKIYQAITYNPHDMANPYVYTLMDGIDKLYGDVEWKWGKIFWEEDIFNVDIIHIHWPTELIWSQSGYHTPQEIENRLSTIKSHGIKIVVTCHNFEPHYSKNEDKNQTYKVVYNLSDMILHLGEYSRDKMSTLYPNAKHVLLPHHIYDTVYYCKPNRDESIEKLHLSKGYRYILCFGAFRDKEETDLLIDLSSELRDKAQYILAPSFEWRYYVNHTIAYFHSKEYFLRRFHFSWLNRILEKILMRYFRLKYRIIMTCKNFNAVPDEELPYYYGASDLCLIHRKKILNSGNVPMAMMMGKVLVGPAIGNVGEILQKTQNPIFYPTEKGTLRTAVEKGYELSFKGHGIHNRNYAIDNWNTSKIATLLYEYYSSLIIK